MGFHVIKHWQWMLLCVMVFCAAPAIAQTKPAAGGAQGGAAPRSWQQGVFLVFPFENAGSSPHLDWLGEGLEELTIQRLAAAGQAVYSHAGLTAELERDGFPQSAQYSHASMLRIAQELDADYVVFGKFNSDGKNLTVELRLLRVNATTLLPALRETGALETLMDLHARLVWRMLAGNGPGYPLSLNEFAKAQRPVRLDAFEHYARGLLASDDEVRLRELRDAVRLEPNWPDPEFALGETYFARRDCASAIPWLAHVPKTHERHVEAEFATGVCRLWLNQPDRAEEVFSALRRKLRNNGKDDGKTVGGQTQDEDAIAGADLPEILNNLAVARARQGKLAEAQSELRRAADFDPDEDDYPFNLGLLALQSGDFGNAAGFFRQASEREPDNAEDRALLVFALEKGGKKDEADQEREATAEALGPNAIAGVKVDTKGQGLTGIQRISTELDVTQLRLEIETPEATANASHAESETPAARIRRGRQELASGRVQTAEQEFKAALTAEPGNAAAHRGLAEIDRREGKLDEAVKELQASLQSRDSAVVRTMLARVYMEQKKSDLARAEVERALKLAPNYSEAKQILEHLQNAKPAGGAQ